jgi:hypothetical protein
LIATTLREAGFGPLVSVVPPDGEISPRSQIQPESRGKVPGLLGGDGWYGYDFTKPENEPHPENIERWGANVGVLADHYPGLDIDVEDETLAKVVKKFAIDTLGNAPTRFSRPPRMLLMYRTEEPFPKSALKIKYRGAEHTVEVLGLGRQYLVAGKHPSGSDYRWDTPLTDLVPDDLCRVSEVRIEEFFLALQEALEKKGIECERVGGRKYETPAPPQEELLAPSLDALRELVAAMPNDYPDRDTYVAIGHAIKAAAGPDHVEEALEIYQEWAARWDGGNDPDVVARDFASFKAPYRMGWRNLEREAYTRAQEILRTHETETLAVPAATIEVLRSIQAPGLEEDFEYQDGPAPEPPKIIKGLPLVHMRELLAEPDEDTQWLIDGWMPQGGLGLFAAKPKVGKTALLRDLATAVANGRDFLGRKTRQGPVIFIHLEDSRKLMRRELRRLSGGEIYDIHTFEGPTPGDAFQLLWDSVDAIRPVLVIIDTAQRWMRIKKPDDYAEVTAAFDPYIALVREFDPSVVFSHHSPKAQKDDVADAALGSIAFFGSVDTGFFVSRDGDNRRYLTTRQREDQLRDVEGVRLDMDPRTHRFSLGQTRAVTQREKFEREIMAYVNAHPGAKQSEIYTAVTGTRVLKQRALERLVDTGRVIADMGRPLRYTAANDPEQDFNFDDMETE